MANFEHSNAIKDFGLFGSLYEQGLKPEFKCDICDKDIVGLCFTYAPAYITKICGDCIDNKKDKQCSI